MAGWYIRRGEKVVGPVDVAKLKELVAAGRLVPTDQLAKDAAGPWTVASSTKLFANAMTPSPQRSPAIVETAKVPQPVQQPQAEASRAIEAAKAGFGAISSAGSAISRSWAERSRRNHELKLAKIQALALSESRTQIPTSPTPAPVATASPPPQQAINVNVIQQVNFVGGRGKRWSPLVAMLLSFIIPGLGQLYKGQPLNGIVWFLITIVGYACLILPGVVLHFCCIIGAGMGDPYR